MSWLILQRDGQHVSARIEQGQQLPPYDLHGADIRAHSLSLAPVLSMEDCVEGQPCERVYGIYKDSMDLMAKLSNSTYSVYQSQSDWGGVLRETLAGEADLPLSSWLIDSSRFAWIDFLWPPLDFSYKCFASAKGIASHQQDFLPA